MGTGSSIMIFRNGKEKGITDGAGLCSSTRWLPSQRRQDAMARALESLIWSLLSEHFKKPMQVAYALVLGHYSESPFSPDLLAEGRRRVKAVIGVTGSEYDVPVHGQPFFLHLLASTARVLGDPDWRILVDNRESYATGVPVGYRRRLPRTPAVFDRKTRWRSYGQDDFCLELRENYNSAAAAEKPIEEQFAEGRG